MSYVLVTLGPLRFFGIGPRMWDFREWPYDAHHFYTWQSAQAALDLIRPYEPFVAIVPAEIAVDHALWLRGVVHP